MAKFEDGGDLLIEYQESTYVKPGWYLAVFEKAERSSHEEYGPGIRFWFKLTKPKHRGAMIPATGKPQATAGNLTGRLLKGLCGDSWDPKNIPPLQDLYGTHCEIEVADGKAEGSCKVIGVKPIRSDDDEDDEDL